MHGAVKFHVSATDRYLISAIARRAYRMGTDLGLDPIDPLNIAMDITACHANGCALRLKDFLEASTSNFIHDLCGISQHLDRATGRLKNNFLPRCVAEEKGGT